MSPSLPNVSEPTVADRRIDPVRRSTACLEASGLTKTFAVEGRRHTVFQLVRRLLSGDRDRFRALSEVTFQIGRGERVAMIGDNGAGKSTLLRTVAGLYRPDRGTVTVRGTVTLIAGLAVGMVEDLTVTDNVSLYGAIYGIDRQRVRELQPDILEWADLTEFADQKLKRLSTGMRSRLAFSACRYIEADLYLLDEALTAGDRHFQQKCEAVFREYEASGKTMLMATHDLDLVIRHCTHAIWMRKGCLEAFGDPQTVVQRYRQSRVTPRG